MLRSDGSCSSRGLSQEVNQLSPELLCPPTLPLFSSAVGWKAKSSGQLCIILRLTLSSTPYLNSSPCPNTCYSEVTGQRKFQASTQGKPIDSCNGGCREGCCGGEKGLSLRSPDRTRTGTQDWGRASWLGQKSLLVPGLGASPGTSGRLF